MTTTSFKFSERITAFPVIHGSGDYSLEVRRFMLENSFDCLAVPLPHSFKKQVTNALGCLPQITIVTQRERDVFSTDWTPESESDEDARSRSTYVTVDPCQGVIMALRIAEQERLPSFYIDRETSRFEPLSTSYPDPYVLKKVAPEKFAAAMLPQIPKLSEFHQKRVAVMANKLWALEKKYKSILFVCSMMEWPWVRQAYKNQVVDVDHEVVTPCELHQVAPATLTFALGELPHITGLYERARHDIEDDENLTVDGVKEMLLETRQRYQEDLGKRARPITPSMLTNYLRYVRNLSLMESRLTPDLYTLVLAASQIMGDQFAQNLAEVSSDYPYIDNMGLDEFQVGVGAGKYPDGDVVHLENRLPGTNVMWRSVTLSPKVEKYKVHKNDLRWSDMTQCSWPPEDEAIESFRSTVTDRALSMLGHELAQSEKFTASVKDGLDIRETLRNWHTGDLYVKVIPPSMGALDAVLMFFDSPADPREYSWRTTWMAENQNESTLSFYATDFKQDVVGPNIGLATYGGCLFLFPPRPIFDVWRDPRLNFTSTLEEKLLAAACVHSNERHVAVLSESAPGMGWKKLAKKYDKKLIHVPLSSFSASTIQQLRMVHVLNGHEVRSYASHFIRKA